MRFSAFVFRLFLSGIVPLALSFSAAAAPITWVVPVLQRIERNSAPGTGTAVAIQAGRGETVSFQIAVQAPVSGLTNLTFAVTPLAGPGGATIGSQDLQLYRENFVTIKHHTPVFYPRPKNSNLPLTTHTFPDALIPFIDPLTGKPPLRAQYIPQPINLKAATDTAYWVDVEVPAGTAAGTYSGTYSVSSDQGQTSGTVQLTVLPFTVPLVPTLRSTMNSDTTKQSGETEELLHEKLMPDVVPLADENSLITQFGLASSDLGFSSGAYYGHCKMSPAPSVEALTAARQAQDPRLFLFDYSADEIEHCTKDIPLVKQWAQNLHAAGIPNLITIPPVPALLDDGSGTGRSAVDIWTVLPVEYVKAQTYNPPRITQVLAKGDSVWFYTALAQDDYSPKWEVDFLPINYRISTGFLNVSQGLTGILYWSVDYWTAHPWTDIEYGSECSGTYCWSYPGEGFMVYPGKEAGLAGVAPSLRIKYIRDGVQDYERFAILQRCGHGEEAVALSQTIAASYQSWTQDDAQLLSVSQQLAGLIVQYGCSQ